MCGILAVISDSRPVDASALVSATTVMARRGPDGVDTWIAPSGLAGLGHTRLAIIDLVGGAQPIVSEDGRSAIVANGEFYDFQAVRRELTARGHRLRTRSDSEIALPLYRERGPGCLDQLRGEFAFAIWDDARQTLFAARDRFGVKPLFFARAGGRLVVASEVRALFAAGVRAEWDPEAVYRNLFLCLPPDRTLFKAVRQVPPGHYLVASPTMERLVRYWDQDYPPRRSVDQRRPERDWLEQTRAAVGDAVERRLVADVPIASYLSGGLDSSAVLGLAARRAGKLAAFTVAFGDPGYDESAVAARTAEHVGAEFHAVPAGEEEAAAVLEEAFAQGENVHYNAHGAARYLLARAVRRAGYKCVLAGEGADELFAGYDFSSGALDASARGAVSRWLGIALALVRPATRAERVVATTSPFLARAARVLGLPRPLVESAAEILEQLRSLLAPDFVHAFRDLDPCRDLFDELDARRALAGREPVKQILYLWMKSVFPGYVLGAERLDACHGVEVRLPFLDHELFEFARGVPASLLCRDGRRKHLLRQAVRDVVTEEVYRAGKQPFFAPPSALRPARALYRGLERLLRGRDLLPGFFDHAAVEGFLDRLPSLDERTRSAVDPLLFALASMSVLHCEHRL